MTYRYNSNAAQWWPARGEDTKVDWLPGRPGKAVQLELKTTTVVGHGIHLVLVNLGQLWEYRQRPLSFQPFYAFPWPDPFWPGTLDEAALAAGVQVTDLAFSRSGSGWWFADWMVVLTAAQVAGVLSRELAAHGSGKRDKAARLVRFDVNDPKPAWGASGKAAAPRVIRWRDFWPALDRCGQTGWPQLIRIPKWLIKEDGSYQPDEVLTLLRQSAESFEVEQVGRGSLVTLEHDSNGNYRIPRDYGDQLAGADDDAPVDGGAGGDADHRQCVFLDALVFRAGRTRRRART